jgi:hypothetical protein
MDRNDQPLRSRIKRILKIIPERRDNQQRELLMILERKVLNAEIESQLYSLCTEIWKDVSRNSPLRFHALKITVAIAKKHPGLLFEVKLLVASPYIDNLTVNVQKSISKLLSKQ